MTGKVVIAGKHLKMSRRTWSVPYLLELNGQLECIQGGHARQMAQAS